MKPEFLMVEAQPRLMKKPCFPLLFHQNKIITNLKKKSSKSHSLFDISKALDKLHQDGLNLKLKQYGISSDLKSTKEFSADRTQRVIFEGPDSSWAHVKPRIFRGSIFEPLWFLTYVNDLPVNQLSTPNLCADNKSLFLIVNIIHCSIRYFK